MLIKITDQLEDLALATEKMALCRWTKHLLKMKEKSDPYFYYNFKDAQAISLSQDMAMTSRVLLCCIIEAKAKGKSISTEAELWKDQSN